MNDHNLDDLIIDNIAPKNGKAKNILTIIALLIVVLIVAIILTKIILKDPNAEQLALEKDNSTEMISPELTLQNATETKKAQKKTTLSTIIEDEPKAPVPAPKEVKEKTPKIETPVKKEVTVKKTKLPEESVAITKEFAQVPTEQEIKPTVKKPIKEETPKIEESKKEPVQTAKPAPIKIIEKAKEHPTGRPVNVPKKIHAAQGYFIQVGSFTQTPSSRFLSIIKNSGFNYTITPAAKNGTKKLLIGPYDNRKAVDTALVRVRDRINKQAFVIKK